MQSRSVGDSGLRVSRLGLGTMTWGRDITPREAAQLLETFCGAGGSLVDTAAAYGHGEVERLLGSLLATVVDREDVVLATKAGFVTRDGERVVDTSRRTMLDDLADSPRRPRVEAVDLWQVHAWGDAPIEETLAALDHAVSTGMARYVGVSHLIGWPTAPAVKMWSWPPPGAGGNGGPKRSAPLAACPCSIAGRRPRRNSSPRPPAPAKNPRF